MFGIVFVGLMGHYPILEIILIRTEGALRSPLTYDDHPIHPSTPIHFLLYNAPGAQYDSSLDILGRPLMN